MSGPEAQEILTGKPSGTYLIRFSQYKGCYAGSYVDGQGDVGKCLIKADPQFSLFDQGGITSVSFTTMEELIEHFNGIFKIPYVKGTNEALALARKNIQAELLATERTYVTSLDVLVNKFFLPVKALPKPPISKEETQTVFANVYDIAREQKKFLQILENGALTGIMDQLSRIEEVTIEYANNYDDALETVTKLSSNKNWKKFLDSVFQQPEVQHNSIQAYLIMPVQRILRYKLLFEDLLKKTDPNHDEYYMLLGIVDRIAEISTKVNEEKRKHESNKKLGYYRAALKAEKKMPSDLWIKADRIFIRESDAKLRSAVKGKTEERRLIMCNDMIVELKKESKEKFAYKGVWPLTQAIVLDVPDTQKEKNVIKVNCIQEVTLIFKDPAEKQLWLTDLAKYTTQGNREGRTSTGSMISTGTGSQVLSPLNQPRKISNTPAVSSNVGSRNSTGDLYGSVPEIIPSGSPVHSPSKNAPVYGAVPVNTPPNALRKSGSHNQLFRRNSAGPSNSVSPPVGTGTSPLFSSSHGKASLESLNLPDLPPDWAEVRTPEGRSYYYHKQTRKTQWERPTQ